MTTEKYLKIALPLTLAGVLFSGYLSGIKFFSGICAFKEACPTFLGYPACYYGFAMFSTMFVATVIAFAKKAAGRWPIRLNLIVSVMGMIFSGSFTVREMAVWFTEGFKSFGLLGLSTCAYGFVFFIIVFVFSLVSCLKRVASDKAAAPVVPPPAPPQA
ncbi:MAG: hypothetical protein WCT10_00370 [Patescibacteria group bacterium]|jgi:uncharacterized membrane protein